MEDHNEGKGWNGRERRMIDRAGARAREAYARAHGHLMTKPPHLRWLYIAAGLALLLVTLLAVWIALLAGTGLTVYAATLDLAPYNAAVALGIATIKATLVALFFMHVWHASEKLTKLVVIAALFFLLLLLGLTMSDYATRLWS